MQGFAEALANQRGTYLGLESTSQGTPGFAPKALSRSSICPESASLNPSVPFQAKAPQIHNRRSFEGTKASLSLHSPKSKETNQTEPCQPQIGSTLGYQGFAATGKSQLLQAPAQTPSFLTMQESATKARSQDKHHPTKKVADQDTQHQRSRTQSQVG